MTYHAIDPDRAPDARRGQIAVAYCGAVAYARSGVAGEIVTTRHMAAAEFLSRAARLAAPHKSLPPRTAQACTLCLAATRRTP